MIPSDRVWAPAAASPPASARRSAPAEACCAPLSTRSTPSDLSLGPLLEGPVGLREGLGRGARLIGEVLRQLARRGVLLGRGLLAGALRGIIAQRRDRGVHLPCVLGERPGPLGQLGGPLSQGRGVLGDGGG